MFNIAIKLLKQKLVELRYPNFYKAKRSNMHDPTPDLILLGKRSSSFLLLSQTKSHFHNNNTKVKSQMNHIVKSNAIRKCNLFSEFFRVGKLACLAWTHWMLKETTQITYEIYDKFLAKQSHSL